MPAASAQAATVTIGSPLTGAFSPGSFIGSDATLTNLVLPEPGAAVRSPITGTVIRWRITQASGGPFRLRVLTPGGGTTYTGAGASQTQTPPSYATQQFSTALPISAGQAVGLDQTWPAEVGVTGATGASYGFWDPPLGDTEMRAGSTGSSDTEVGFNADVQPPPGIASLGATSGSIAGSTPVAVAGHDFSGATAVAFGAVPAQSFAVASDNQINAVSPPASSPGPVEVSVTTAAGKAAAGDRFTYLACVVPKLKGAKLKADKRKLRKADCKLGKVKGHGKKVKKQSAKPGSVLAPGSNVKVALG